jgi:hypothetical protein
LPVSQNELYTKVNMIAFEYSTSLVIKVCSRILDAVIELESCGHVCNERLAMDMAFIKGAVKEEKGPRVDAIPMMPMLQGQSG